MLQNKLLERQLKNIIIDLKYQDLLLLFNNFHNFADHYANPIFKKKGLKCSQCILTFDQFAQTGYGRTQDQALGNAIKSLFDIIISNHHKIEEVKLSLKYLNKELRRKVDETMVELNESIRSKTQQRMNVQNSWIRGEDKEQYNNGICNCVYAVMHEEYRNRITNLQQRLKLMCQQNMILKQLLVKGVQQQQVVQQSRKQNINMQNNRVILKNME